MLALEAREDALKAKLVARPEPKVLLNPNMAELYRSRAAVLHELGVCNRHSRGHGSPA